MNCPQARFLLYAHMDRELSQGDAEALSRHLAQCGPCAARAESARGLARVLRSRLDRAPAPDRLVSRLHNSVHNGVHTGAVPSRTRTSSYFFAAAVALMVFPLVADTPARRGVATTVQMGMIPAAPRVPLVSKRMTGTFVCVQCEARQEAGVCPITERSHVPAFCADNGEIWRLMLRDPRFGEAAFGRTATLEGTAFPESGFLRANRVGY